MGGGGIDVCVCPSRALLSKCGHVHTYRLRDRMVAVDILASTLVLVISMLL